VTFRKRLIAWVFGENQMNVALRLGGHGGPIGASVADGSARGAVLLGPAGRPQPSSRAALPSKTHLSLQMLIRESPPLLDSVSRRSAAF
jgi:hypothetical protein